MKVSIFVDGQNTWHSLKKLDTHLTEEKIDWIRLFNSFLHPSESIETILWFRPAKVSEIYLKREIIARQLILDRYNHQQEDLLAKLDNLPPNIFKEVKKEFNERLFWLKNFKSTFNHVSSKYRQFSFDYPQIKVYKAGFLKVDPYQKKIIGEKGVDVAIASKIVEHSITNKCSRIIIVSGDSDYAEAVKIAIKYDKKVYCLKFGNTLSNNHGSLMSGIYDVTLKDIKTHFWNE